MKKVGLLLLVLCLGFAFNSSSFATPKLKVDKKVTATKKGPNKGKIKAKVKAKKKVFKKININRATAKQLAKLKGIGMKKARAIIDYRRKHGKFRKYADLAKVKGISMDLVKKIKPYITLK